jgi:hypothetical protein
VIVWVGVREMVGDGVRVGRGRKVFVGVFG